MGENFQNPELQIVQLINFISFFSLDFGSKSKGVGSESGGGGGGGCTRPNRASA